MRERRVGQVEGEKSGVIRGGNIGKARENEG